MYGFRLTFAQAKMMAERHCTPAELERVHHAYHVALVLHAKKHKLRQTFMPFIHRGAKFIFWAIGVRAVWKSHPHVKWEAPEIPNDYLCLPGVEFGKFQKGILRWPRDWDPPDWLWPMFMDSAMHTLEYTLKMGRPKPREELIGTEDASSSRKSEEVESTTDCNSNGASTVPLNALTTSTHDTSGSFIVQSMRFMP
ncbi:hypothetical protein CYLTODRAFT_418201 [Cylindrobasidium torrendii FP15055 ss-10]|uniref:Uncharacterized protein n=1 Tax=Cylindrobasidium torrendii FP15055 ss-10 TaxID=1314674 RepID=A0A0D7BP81_9AGAR|nr:hypothetical protein CYLTODRAFT_418201 [Cylindrobasidium torrendii FP15055 ss-10]